MSLLYTEIRGFAGLCVNGSRWYSHCVHIGCEVCYVHNNATLVLQLFLAGQGMERSRTKKLGAWVMLYSEGVGRVAMRDKVSSGTRSTSKFGMKP